ncbi:coiled-coil domain-containing protein 13 isoform X3 [Podarcis raffonei]|uniref:coiled-coil domain-containing protein 13 isoform X3 n=1 Tax=Podarcis raffonei TaxID=65483 RepID=UPI0023299D08|nr:coiled-coil domain-containing protein 13 isoform X3 [Podarcis raffonei]
MATVAEATASRSGTPRAGLRPSPALPPSRPGTRVAFLCPQEGSCVGRPGLGPERECIMEPDEEVNENLRMQLKALQEQQQKRMQNLMEKKKEKQQQSVKQSEKGNPEEAFGVQDDLGLYTVGSEMSKEHISKRLLENENDQLQQQLRETVDENGRLHKVLKERDFEIKQLHKKIEEERLALLGTSGVPGDVAATKIVELAKQNRHMTAEVEKEKTKVKQLNNRIKELEKEIQMSSLKPQSLEEKDSQSSRKATEVPLSPEMKALQEKLTAANFKVSEFRNQLQTTKQELKMTQKLLANEVGEDINIQNLLSTPGTWRGRAQQILILQGKVRDLENQLGHSRSRLSESSTEEEAVSLTDSRKTSASKKNLQRIRSLEKEKKEALEKLSGEHNTLRKDYEELKQKLDGSKARNKVLSHEVKTLKEQISTLLDKGKHDDELVDALLSQQKEMQAILKNLSQQDERTKESHQNLEQQLSVEVQKQNCLIEQLKQMVAEREARVKELEEEVQQFASQHHRKEESSPDSLSTLSAESLEEGNGSSGSRRDDLLGSNSSARMVSKMGHTLVDSVATSFPTTVSPGRIVEPDNLDMKTVKIQIAEYKALGQAAEAERSKLIEMVNILQKRVDDSTTKVWEAEKKLQEQQRRYIALEQQFEHLKTESGKNSGAPKNPSKNKAATGAASTAQPHNSTRLDWNVGDRSGPPSAQRSEVPLESQIEELSTRLAIQMDENESLKMALQDSAKTKEEDFRLYQETVGQVKDIFLQALRQQKQDRN